MRATWNAAVATALALCASSAQANERRFGDWTVRVMAEGEGMYAGTVNDSGGQLGLICFGSTGKCLWVLSNRINCRDRSTYPVLVNADSGAASTQVTCMNLDDEPVYAFGDSDVLDRTIRRSERLGIASPLQSGQFAVTRFSLRGAVAAIEFMHAEMNATFNAASNTTEDLRL
jgi:hypothetical protein